MSCPTPQWPLGVLGRVEWVDYVKHAIGAPPIHSSSKIAWPVVSGGEPRAPAGVRSTAAHMTKPSTPTAGRTKTVALQMCNIKPNTECALFECSHDSLSQVLSECWQSMELNRYGGTLHAPSKHLLTCRPGATYGPGMTTVIHHSDHR